MKSRLIAAIQATLVLVCAGGAKAETIYASDETSVFAVDTATGARTVIASGVVGTGAVFLSPRGLVAISPTELAVSATVSGGQGQILIINVNTLARTTLSASTDGNGPNWFISNGIGRDSAGNYYVVDPDVGVLKIHTTTGARTHLTGPLLGTGPALDVPRDTLPFDATRSFVTAGFGGTVIRIDNGTGNRTDVYTDPPSLVAPSGMAIDQPTGHVLIADTTSGYLVRWNPDALTGVVASATSGTTLGAPYDVAVGETGTIYVADLSSTRRGIATVDAVTGAVTPVTGNAAGWNLGSGPEFSMFSTRMYVATPVSGGASLSEKWAHYP